MNIKRLNEILHDSTMQFRKGEVMTKGEYALTIDFNPPVSEARPELVQVDVHFLIIGVHKESAEKYRDEFVGLLQDWPEPDRLRGGPSYIEIGGVIGDQGRAFQFMALGKVLGLWDIITPESFGFDVAEAERLAGSGFIMITGYPKVDVADH